MAVTTYDILRKNRWRTAWLLLLFPAMLATITFLGVLITSLSVTPETDQAIIVAGDMFFTIVPWVTVGSIVWMIIAVLSGKKMILGFAGAKPIEKRDNPELYRTVENLAIQTGIPTPKMYIIEDDSLNAFATGYSPQSGVVAITRGLLNKLSNAELEAVMAHEFGHILHRDTRVMLVAVTMVGIIQLVSELILRSFFYRSIGERDRDNGKAAGIILIAMIAIWLIGFLGAIFVQMGISRKREYMADAQSAHLTRHPDSLISALQKIAADPRVEVLDGKRSIAAMCIADPLERKRNFFEKLNGLFASHPHMADRIQMLQQMR